MSVPPWMVTVPWQLRWHGGKSLWATHCGPLLVVTVRVQGWNGRAFDLPKLCLKVEKVKLHSLKVARKQYMVVS